MLRLLKAGQAAPEDSARSAYKEDGSLDNEPGIHSENAIANNTLYTFVGPDGEPVGYLFLPRRAYDGMVSKEMRTIYDRCVAASMDGKLRIG
jgi:hypothetical protein